MQGGWEGCRGAEYNLDVREASRSAKRFSECRVGGVKRQEGRSAGKSAGRKEAYGWQRSLAGCRSREEAVNKARSGSLRP